jgi:hypothetical protein
LLVNWDLEGLRHTKIKMYEEFSIPRLSLVQ